VATVVGVMVGARGVAVRAVERVVAVRVAVMAVEAKGVARVGVARVAAVRARQAGGPVRRSAAR
jgi:hypothetical protein